MPAILERWWDDPVASSSLAIALVAGIFAVYSLRSVPGERRLRILRAMEVQYASTRQARTIILTTFPFLLKRAYEELAGAISKELELIRDSLSSENPETAALMRSSLRHLTKLDGESVMAMQPEIGISYTSASEILASEFKTRAMLWCVETLNDPEHRLAAGISDDLYDAAKRLVSELNSFALNYENGAYPPRTVFGQLHRSLAPVIKALEPIIWERSTDGRWGRRVLRLGLAAQHFNDVVRIHRSSDLVWSKTEQDKIVVHPARTENIYGKEQLRYNIPTTPRFLPMTRLRVITFYWSVIGRIGPSPSNWRWGFGGLRLRRHVKCQDDLSGCLRFALSQYHSKEARASLSFSWTLETLRRQRSEVVKNSSTSRERAKLPSQYPHRSPGTS